MDTTPWILKYAPRQEKDIIGQDKAVAQLKAFILQYAKQKKKAAFLSGPSGAGKTTSVYAVAKTHGIEVVEVNASDFRNKQQIEEKVGNAIKQYSLFSASKLILVDEVDGLSGTKDRGAIDALLKLMHISRFPIVCTAYNAYEDKLRSLRSKSLVIDFELPDYKAIHAVLQQICTKESIPYQDEDLKTLARRVGGDFRAAINDLQMITTSGKLETHFLEELWQRNKLESVPTALIKIFKNSDPLIAMQAFDNVEEDLDKLFLWIEENLPKEYQGKDLAAGFEMLSKADVFKGRIRRWQHWRFLVYVSALLTIGVATAKQEKSKGFAQYTPTSRLLKYWIANMKYQKRKAMCQKIAEKTHCSTRRAVQDVFPYVHAMIRNDKALGEQLIDEFEFDEGEVEWLRK